MSSGPGDLVEEVTVRLAGLELTISARRLPGGAPEIRAEPSSVTHLEEFEDPYHISAELENQIIRATTAEQLSRASLPFLTYLIGRLRARDPVWTPTARVHRAFRAGVLARRRLDGLFAEEDSLGVPFRNTHYICLRSANNREGFWTTSYQLYIDRVGTRDGGLHSTSISQALPSEVEAQAFLVGARRPWPQRLQ